MKQPVKASVFAGLLLGAAALGAVGSYFIREPVDPGTCFLDYRGTDLVPPKGMLRAFAPIFDPASPEPPGLPTGGFPLRRITHVMKGAEAYLVLVYFHDYSEENPIRGKEHYFWQAYNFFPDSRRVEILETPLTANMSHRLFSVETPVSECGESLKIHFTSCSACGDGSLYSLTAKYSASEKRWTYPHGISTEVHYEEVDPTDES